MEKRILYVEDWAKTVVIPNGISYNSHKEGYPDYVKYCNENNYKAKTLEQYIEEIEDAY